MELETRETKITVDFLSYNQSAFSKKANLNETCLQSLHKLPLRSRIIFFFCTLVHYIYSQPVGCVHRVPTALSSTDNQRGNDREKLREMTNFSMHTYENLPPPKNKRQSKPAS